ncbi:hypothetical protein M422DRAFT_32428 [Sphaerobolus stellatus SS14]|uniref:Uncharacterized protein n=1 Tax=Sphaerobolus stellatus (strain SS14) TaxID=990650 RepID=A0A0C9VPE1_SPHS4|nr:hypothetical protein M422DRAFT_32428 [Sphaerobolus stellatus SS14]
MFVPTTSMFALTDDVTAAISSIRGGDRTQSLDRGQYDDGTKMHRPTQIHREDVI